MDFKSWKCALVVLSFVLEVVNGIENMADVPCGYQSGRGVNGPRAGRIVGGETAARGEFPWLVSITRNGGHFCGGTLISKRWVLTAAHCLCNGKESLPVANLRVSIGQHDLREKDSPIVKSVPVQRVQLHPNYECSRFVHDVAMLELGEDVHWTDAVWPACLPSMTGTKGHSTFSDSEATAAGWGWTNENSNKGGRADVLQKVRLHVLDNSKCREWYKSQGKRITIHDTQICAGFESGGKDSCWADSGGPLMVSDSSSETDGRMTVVGVVSTGIGCARPKLPGLYTRVSDYVPWIQEQMKA